MPGELRAVDNEGEERDQSRSALCQYIRLPEFKRILNQIVFNQNRSGFRSVSVISQLEGEGKTFLVSALAVGYALFLRRRVLIMDTISQTQNESFFMGRILGASAPLDVQVGAADRAPNVRGSRERKGVIDLLTTRSIYRHIEMCNADPTKKIEQETPPPEADEGLDTADFQIAPLLSFLSANYDLILLDTCAISKSSSESMDPLILARQANTSVLVTSAESIDRQGLLSLKNQLQRADINLLGTVYNSGAKHG